MDPEMKQQNSYTEKEVDVCLELRYNYGLKWKRITNLMKIIFAPKKYESDNTKYIREHYAGEPANNSPNTNKVFKKTEEPKKTSSALEFLKSVDQSKLEDQDRQDVQDFISTAESGNVIPLLKGSCEIWDGGKVRIITGYPSDPTAPDAPVYQFRTPAGQRRGLKRTPHADGDLDTEYTQNKRTKTPGNTPLKTPSAAANLNPSIPAGQLVNYAANPQGLQGRTTYGQSYGQASGSVYQGNPMARQTRAFPSALQNNTNPAAPQFNSRNFSAANQPGTFQMPMAPIQQQPARLTSAQQLSAFQPGTLLPAQQTEITQLRQENAHLRQELAREKTISQWQTGLILELQAKNPRLQDAAEAAETEEEEEHQPQAPEAPQPPQNDPFMGFMGSDPIMGSEEPQDPAAFGRGDYAVTAAGTTTTSDTMADPFEKEKAVLKDIRIINLAWFIDIKYRFWTPGEMDRIPEDQQAYYISVLHDFPNIIRNVPAIPTGFHHDTSRVRCATESEIDRWLLARQKANKTRGIEALQAMMPSLWQMMDDHSRQNPSLNDTQIVQSLTSKDTGIPPNLIGSAAVTSKNTSDSPAPTPKNSKTPKK